MTLRSAETRGWTQESAFFDLRGWSLTEDGRAENERRLAAEREQADPERRIAAVHRDFLPLNARLLRACTDWQIRPAPHDPLAANDHVDLLWDERILAELPAIGEALTAVVARLAAVLDRFAGYDTRFAAALERARGGDADWIDRSDIDSCHRVWFQLHEDLIATLGIERGTESAQGRERP